MSIRKLSMVFSGGVAAAVICAAVLAILTEIQRLNTSIKVGDATQIISYLDKATVELSFERSLSQVGLALPGPFPTRFNDMLAEQRRKSDRLFNALHDIVAGTALPRAAEFAQALERERSELAKLRAAIDPDLQRPAAERANRDGGVIDRLKSSVVKIKDLGDLLRPNASELPPTIAAQDLVMQRAWIIREYGGRERTHFAIATATGLPVPEASLPEMYEAHGRVSQAWDLTARLMLRTTFSPEIAAALETLKRTYFEEYQTLRLQMYAGARSGTFPVDFETYFARSSEALDAAVAVVLRAGEANVRLAAEMKRDAQWKLITIIAISFIALVLVGLLVRFFLVRVAGRIVAVTEAMRQLADGKLDLDLAPFAGRDEVGAMVQAIGVFRDNAIARRALEAKGAADRSKELIRQDRLERLIAAFRSATLRIQESLSADMRSMQDAAGELSEAGRSSAQEADKAEVSSRRMDQSMQSIGAVVGDLARAVQDLAGHTQATREMVSRAIGVAADTRTNVTTLSSAAERIGTVVNLIRAIAGQTNLLALNATIEAARAGEAGKGFAVVAAEVKSLAMQTARATDEIEQHVGGIQMSTSQAVESITSITATIDDIAEIIKALTGAVEFQEAAARSIGASINEANEDSRTVAHGLSHVGQTIAKTNNQAQLVTTVSTQVGALSDELSRTVHEFLEGVAEDVDDRRREHRTAADEPVEVLTAQGSMTCRLVDVCPTGFKIALDRDQLRKVRKDDAVAVAMKNGRTVKAVVVWVSTTHAGLQITEAKQAVPTLLAA